MIKVFQLDTLALALKAILRAVLNPMKTVQNFKEGLIEAESGIQLYFRAMGPGDEAVVIPLAAWTEEFDILARGRRVIFYDPRSRGRSTAVEPERISFQNDVSDLEAVRRHFGLEQISPIGWSYFGGVVARYAMELPERVSRLVMVCGPPIRRQPHSDAMNRIMAARINAVAPGFLQEMQAASPPSAEMFSRMWDLLKQARTGSRGMKPARGEPSQYPNESPARVAAVFSRAMQTMGDWDWREDARRAGCPALFVHGTADFMPLEAAQEWAECLPGGRLHAMEDVGHFPSLEDPERFFAGLEEFLSGDAG